MPTASTSITTLAAVIDLVISLEKYGRDFYAQASEMASEPECKAFFSWLVEQEDDHHKTYLTLKKQTLNVDLPQEKLLGGYGQFIEMLVREVTENLIVSANPTLDDAIAKSLLFEESVVRYFEKVKILFPAEQARVIEEICAEERKHIDAILEYTAHFEVS
ncbi:ferritin-like domain-containing protein [Geopsychrobacter electrodiphilus]|uniref:ferritin-like domain-containing protein n=1 Tax=Geopsychrobacter electrodiphilus TaxID=225196 RepID=UPI00036FDB08|nr:ferritin family protein [Geopsychrobacter electrodiphilus]